MSVRYTFALAGNQNSGKTTLFNVLIRRQSACRDADADRR